MGQSIMTRFEAVDFCAISGGWLVTIKTPEKNNGLLQLTTVEGKGNKCYICSKSCQYLSLKQDFSGPLTQVKIHMLISGPYSTVNYTILQQT